MKQSRSLDLLAPSSLAMHVRPAARGSHAVVATLALATAVGVTLPARAQPETSNAVAEAGDALPFAVRPSVRERQSVRRDEESGALAWIGTPLRVIVAQGWRVHPLDIESWSGLDLDARYDVMLRPADRRKRTAAELLRNSLPNALGFEATLQERVVRVQVLRRQEDAPPLEPSRSPGQSLKRRPGEIRATRMPMLELVTLTRWYSPYPVVDETGLDGEYDWVLQWDSSGDRRDFFLALHDLGLELAAGKRSFPFLVLSESK